MEIDQEQMSVLKELRARASLSQAQVAEKLGVVRQSYIKYENGSAELPLSVLRKLAQLYDVEYSCLIDNVMPEEPQYIVDTSVNCCKEAAATYSASINISGQNLAKFSNVFLYVLRNIGAKPNVGQGVLFKLLYFMDFDFYEMYSHHFMGLSYLKGVSGPTPVDFSRTIRFLNKNGVVDEVRTMNYQQDMVKFLPVVEPNLELLSAQELLHIDRTLQKYSDKTSAELEKICEQDAPWQKAKARDILNYEDVFSRSKEMSVRNPAMVNRKPLDFTKYNTHSRVWNDNVQELVNDLRRDRG